MYAGTKARVGLRCIGCGFLFVFALVWFSCCILSLYRGSLNVSIGLDQANLSPLIGSPFFSRNECL